MARNNPSTVIVDDAQLALEAQEAHDLAEDWAAMSPAERKRALRDNPAAAEAAREAARAEGFVE